MATTKRFQGIAPTGLTLYFTAWDEAGLFCDNADGDFRFPPASYLLPATEIGTTGVYYRNESRMTWDDGTISYILVNAGGLIYATGGKISVRGDIVIDNVFIIRILRSIVAQLGRVLAKIMGA